MLNSDDTRDCNYQCNCDKEETEEESSMQSTDNEDEVQARGSFLL